MPDCFVPLDTTRYAKCYRELSAKSIIINANLQYVDQNRKQLQSKYKTFEQFNREFEVPQTLIDKIKAQAEKDKIKIKNPNEEWQQTMPMLRTQLKALIARDLWDMSEYFAIMNQQNHIVQRALKEF